MTPPGSRSALRTMLGITRPLTTVPVAALGPATDLGGGVLMHPLTLSTADGGDLPCLYLEPVGPGPWPGAVAVHQHNRQFHLGKTEPAGLAGDPTMAYGLAMARLGVATVVPDLVGFEARQGPLADGADAERLHAFHLLAQGSSLQAQHVQDVALCLTWLAARPQVTGGIGLVGHSLGGQVAFFTAACDERVSAAVISCGIGTIRSFHREAVLHNPAWYVPGILPAGDSPAVAAVASGQRFWVSAGRHDPLFPLDGVHEVVAGFPPGAAQLHLLDAGHELPAPAAADATRWLAAVLRQD